MRWRCIGIGHIGEWFKIPLRMGVLSKVGDVFVSDVAVGKEMGNVLVLRSVGGVELVGVKFEPVEELVCW